MTQQRWYVASVSSNILSNLSMNFWFLLLLIIVQFICTNHPINHPISFFFWLVSRHEYNLMNPPWHTLVQASWQLWVLKWTQNLASLKRCGGKYAENYKYSIRPLSRWELRHLLSNTVYVYAWYGRKKSKRFFMGLLESSKYVTNKVMASETPTPQDPQLTIGSGPSENSWILLFRCLCMLIW